MDGKFAIQQTINVTQSTFMNYFDKVNEMSNSDKLPIGLLDQDGELVGVYFSRSAFAKSLTDKESIHKTILSLKEQLKKLNGLLTNNSDTSYPEEPSWDDDPDITGIFNK